MKQTKNYSKFMLLFAILLIGSFISFVSAFSVPPELKSLYENTTKTFAVSEENILIYSNESITMYYIVHNKEQKNSTYTLDIKCISKKCPKEGELIFDTFFNQELKPNNKAGAGIFIMANETTPGIYKYKLEFKINNQVGKFPLEIEVIPRNVLSMIWYNFKKILGFA